MTSPIGPIVTGTDLSDVENALADLIDRAVYPNGDGSPSVVGCAVTTGRSWPVNTALQQALDAGNAIVTVYALPNMATVSTRYRPAWVPVTPQPAATLSLQTAGVRATVSGTVASGGQAVGVRLNGVVQVYQVQPTDTPASIAVAVAALVPGAIATEATVTFPAAPDLAVRLSVPVVCTQEVYRSKQAFQISLWCPTPDLRDALGRVVAPALMADFILLPDGTQAFMTPGGTAYDDKPEVANLWIRHLRVFAEYGTTLKASFAQSLFVNSTNSFAAT